MSDKNKTKEILSNIFGYLLIVATCALYVLTAVFILNPTDKTFWQAIADGFLSLGIGITLDYLFRQQGIISGLKSESLTKTMILYGSTIEKINDYINKLGNWCVNKNCRTYKEQRTKILSRAGLRYQDCFYDDGTAKPYFADFEELPIIKNREKLKDKNTRKSEKIRIKSIKRKNKEAKKDAKYKNKCYWLAVKLKLTELYQNDLTSEGGKKEDPNNLGPTILGFVIDDSIKTWVVKILLAAFFGVYGITLIVDFSLFELLYRAFQICLFCVLGLVKLRKSKMFITNDYRGRIIKKINNLEEFYADLELNIHKPEQIIQENEVKGETENGEIFVNERRK